RAPVGVLGVVLHHQRRPGHGRLPLGRRAVVFHQAAGDGDRRRRSRASDRDGAAHPQAAAELQLSRPGPEPRGMGQGVQRRALPRGVEPPGRAHRAGVARVHPEDRRESPVKRILSIAAMALVCAQAAAQGYPAKPVRMVIPFPPGGSSDAVGRVIGERLSEEWKQPVIIDNKPGAGTTIASKFVAESAPDGYTFYLQGVSTHASAGALYRNLSFDPVKAFAPVVNVSQAPFILVVNPSVKVSSAKELVDLGRAKPGALKAASSGAGGSPHLFVEMLARATGNQFLHVPCKGMGPAMLAIVAGEVDFLVADVTVMPQVRAGKVRALAVTTPKQSEL